MHSLPNCSCNLPCTMMYHSLWSRIRCYLRILFISLSTNKFHKRGNSTLSCGQPSVTVLSVSMNLIHPIQISSNHRSLHDYSFKGGVIKGSIYMSRKAPNATSLCWILLPSVFWQPGVCWDSCPVCILHIPSLICICSRFSNVFNMKHMRLIDLRDFASFICFHPTDMWPIAKPFLKILVIFLSKASVSLCNKTCLIPSGPCALLLVTSYLGVGLLRHRTESKPIQILSFTVHSHIMFPWLQLL